MQGVKAFSRNPRHNDEIFFSWNILQVWLILFLLFQFSFWLIHVAQPILSMILNHWRHCNQKAINIIFQPKVSSSKFPKRKMENKSFQGLSNSKSHATVLSNRSTEINKRTNKPSQSGFKVVLSLFQCKINPYFVLNEELLHFLLIFTPNSNKCNRMVHCLFLLHWWHKGLPILPTITQKVNTRWGTKEPVTCKW